jgi:GNAT superfamily N-acetyltransferase
MSYSVSTDDRLLDVERIHRWLSEDAYWSLGRSLATVERSLRGSLNVGAYDGDDQDRVQVGLLRIVTDGATFAWVCDVYVDPAHRGAGVGGLLLAEADARLGEMGVRRALLATADAHALYAEHGYAPLAEPGRWMARSYESESDGDRG